MHKLSCQLNFVSNVSTVGRYIFIKYFVFLGNNLFPFITTMLFLWRALLIMSTMPIAISGSNEDWKRIEKYLTTGDVSAVHSLQKADILLFLDKIALMPLTANVKRAVWDVIKSPTNEPASVTADTLLRMGNLLAYIPDLDLYALNVSSWDVVEALGTALEDRRRLGIVAYATLNVWGPQVVSDDEALHRFRGIICGLPPHVLHKIQPSILVKISRDVIKYFRGCGPHQYEVRRIAAPNDKTTVL